MGWQPSIRDTHVAPVLKRRKCEVSFHRHSCLCNARRPRLALGYCLLCYISKRASTDGLKLSMPQLYDTHDNHQASLVLGATTGREYSYFVTLTRSPITCMQTKATCERHLALRVEHPSQRSGRRRANHHGCQYEVGSFGTASSRSD